MLGIAPLSTLPLDTLPSGAPPGPAVPAWFAPSTPTFMPRTGLAQRSALYQSLAFVAPMPAVPAWFRGVHPDNVQRSARPGESARLPSGGGWSGPTAKPFIPAEAIGSIPMVFPQRTMMVAQTSHRRPAFFAPSRVINDATVTPIGSAGVATIAIDAEVGSSVTYRFVTDVRKFWSGLEQRASLQARPQESYQFSTIVDDDIARELRSMLAGHTADAAILLLGLAHEGAIIASSTTTTITCHSLALADWAFKGARFVAMHPTTGRYVAGFFNTAPSGNVIGTSVDCTAVAVAGGTLMPGMGVYLDATLSISRYQVSADRLDLVAEAEITNPAPTIGIGGTVNSYDSNPVWDFGVGVTGTVAQPLASGVSKLGVGGRVRSTANFTRPDWGRMVRLVAERFATWQSVKLFLHTTKGRAISFLLPTGRPDLVLASGDASSGVILVNGPPTVGATNYVADWFPSLAHRRLKLVRTDGTSDYRKVSSAVDNGNGTQSLTLDSAMTGAISRIEFLELVRWKNDTQRISFSSSTFRLEEPAQVVQQ